ncbi:MAG: P-II family nitrogen regulator [Nitrososphaeria archaeon]|nr:P-II family nitrogen regulator [Nitrosopumilaceae archaeon]NIP10176.1 P-II family nitrogen regulator [Nitrosopumilaceae archaeon]NIP91539.1 P-II family nitrogen regulator [Nitrososphaeria archaeon]NIS95374.1 P-II family nitrogen regulator [Nitrosopumilaceae archaeon]
MKRIDALVPSIKRTEVVDKALKAGAEGITLVESRGKGSGERPMVGGARGTARYIAGYNRIDTVTIVCADSKLDEIVDAIMKAAYTGSSGDGIIFVSTVDTAYKIGTKEKIS